MRDDESTPLRGRDVVCISSIDWDFLWQGHQEIMSRFARAGSDVVFIENTGVRSARLSDVPRLVKRLVRWARSMGRRPGAAGGLSIVSPLLLPFTRSRLAEQVNQRVLVPRLASRVRRLVGPDPILFSYLPTSNALALARALRGDRSVLVYYCVADFIELSDDPEGIRRSEQQLAREADLIFVQGPDLAERFRDTGRPVHVIKAGVDLDRFDPGRFVAPSAELAALPRPIIGYSGGLHEHVDVDLLHAVAGEFADASVVLVGPVQHDMTTLLRRPNVTALGMRAPDALPSLIAAMDVTLVPYRRTRYTETVFPTKLFEYLAMGRPVVSTRLPEVLALGLPEFAVRCVDGPAFPDAIRAALEDRRNLAEQRREVAAAHDWKNVVATMASLIGLADR